MTVGGVRGIGFPDAAPGGLLAARRGRSSEWDAGRFAATKWKCMHLHVSAVSGG